MKRFIKTIISVIIMFSLCFSAFAEILPQPMQGREQIEEKPLPEHPRLMFRSSEIEKIREGLTHEQNEYAYAEFANLARFYRSGELPESDTYNYDEKTLQILEANAFDYIINGNTEHGEWAYKGMTNFMNTLNYNPDEGKGANYHDASHVLFIAAEVYDWCYALMDNAEKTAFIEAGQTLMQKLDWGYPVNLERASMVSGAGSTTMLLVDLFSFSIATYDENPDLYNYLSAVIKQMNMPGRNYWYESQRYISGSSYGALRAFSDAWLYWMLDNAVGTAFHNESFLSFADYILFEFTPDGKYFREGDDNWHAVSQYKSTDFDDSGRFTILNILASLTGNRFYKEKALEMLPVFADGGFSYGYVPFTAVQFLFVNDTGLSGEDLSGMPNTRYFGYPDGTMIAKTGWEAGNESGDAVAFMKIGGNQLYDHNHNDMGSFQLYYKGNLVQDLGIYARTDQAQYYGYNTSTVSHNSLLIYDPLEYMYPRSVLLKNSGTDEYYDVNAGGQNYIVPVSGHSSYLTYNEKLYNRADVTSYGFGPDSKKPEYSYISGDITNAYSADKVKNADRSMMFMPTGIEGSPAVFMVMDKVTSENKYMDKKFLFQCLTEPVINGNAITMSRGTLSTDEYKGEITSQILSPKSFKIDSFGGPGSQWMVNGYNFTPHGYSNADTRLDFGWGRLEISSTEENETEYFLNVMYMNDKGKYQSVQTAELIEDENFIGGKVLNKVTLFNKDEKKIQGDFSVSIPGSAPLDVAITGLGEGNWKVLRNGSIVSENTVTEECGVLYFNGEAGEYEIKKSNLPTPEADVTYEDGIYKFTINSAAYSVSPSFEIKVLRGNEEVYKNTVAETEISIPSLLADKEYSVFITAISADNKSDTFEMKLNTSFGGGEGTKENPYKISTSKHFLNIEKYEDCNFILTDNIIIAENYIPFSFSGNLNGNGKSVMLNLNHPSVERVGMFSALSETARVYDLSVYGKVNGYSYVGSVAGYSNGSIKNCINYADITAGLSYAGGIAGYTKSFINSVRNCLNYGVVKTNSNSHSSYKYAGGITGYNESPVILCGNFGEVMAGEYAGGISGTGNGDIYGSYNHGDITSNGVAGGIAGLITGNHVYKECYNAGKINGATVGGIIGYKDYEKNTVLRCYNIGEVSSRGILGGYSEKAGALANISDCYVLEGFGEESAGVSVVTSEELKNQGNLNFDFENIWCFNEGDYLYPQLKYATEAPKQAGLPVPVYTEADFNSIKDNPYGSYILMNDVTLGSDYVPFAFAGEFDGGNNKITLNISTEGTANTGLFSYLYGSPTVENLVLDGAVSSNGKASDNHTRTGALAGSLGISDNKLTGSAVIRNIVNYADVTSLTGHSTGGIIGDAYYHLNKMNVTIEQCSNHGTVKSAGTYTGGIAGIADTYVSVSYCANYKSVSGGASVGGIAGGMYGRITSSFNTGTVSVSGALANAGGIAGSTASASAFISNCYNSGIITGTNPKGANSAGIVGNDMTGGTISKCYNIGEISSGLAIIATVKTATEEKPGYTKISDCYYLSESEEAGVEGIYPLTSDTMSMEESFNGFDFVNEWIIDETSGYPYPNLRKIKGNIYNPDIIKTATEFINMDPSGSYVLGADIDLSAGYMPFEFSGNLNGNGYTVTLNHNYPENSQIGLFSILTEDAYVSDVVIKGNVTAASNVGSIAGVCDGKVSGCVNYATVSVPKTVPSVEVASPGQRGGGIAGTVNSKGSIDGCINYGDVWGRSSYFGGISGVNNGKIVLSANFGKIESYSGGGGYGGIAGNQTNGTTEKCANYGRVDANGAAGGIIGQGAGTSYITNCYNAGNIHSDNSPAGGILGVSASNKDTITCCYNVGKVDEKNNDVSVSDAFIGSPLSEDTQTTVTDSYYNNSDSAQTGTFGAPIESTKLDLKESYGKFDFENVWEMGTKGYYYPQIKGLDLGDDFCYNPYEIKEPSLYSIYNKAVELLSLSKLTSAKKTEIFGKYALLSYAEVADGNLEFVLKEQGVVISAYDSTPSLYEEMCISKASTALSGTHGMLLYGNLNPYQEYYVRSYASYEYNGNIYTLYSDVETSYPSLTTF